MEFFIKKIEINNLKILGLLLLITFLSCNNNFKQNEHLTKEYFYKNIYHNREEYTYRKYSFLNDTIKVFSVKFDHLGKKIEKSERYNTFLKNEYGLNLLFEKSSSIISEEKVFNVKSIDSCIVYFDPYFFEVKNCYKGLSEKKEYIFTSNQISSHGYNYKIYFDKDFCITKVVNELPSESFKKEYRIDKDSLPSNIKVMSLN